MNPQRRIINMQRIFNPSQYRSSTHLMSTLNKENFNRIMMDSIQKAILSSEAPVKEKHVRKLLIGTYQSMGGDFFWQLLPIIRLKEQQIACWKFCHVLHKMLRDGHKQFLLSSHERRQVLLDCGNMWRHVEDGYGQLIFRYCTLLYNRIAFLMNNPNFPNDLKLTDDQLDDIGRGDPNIFFDLSCEIFDALDDILRLKEAVLMRTESKRLNSMTTAGQCHLAPLIVCIQDSSHFYDYSVKILFKLHSTLPSSTLEGHRSRFLGQHNSLRDFYLIASNLQYFKTLIQIPHLPDRTPNFLVASDLQQHVAPQVIMISDSVNEPSDQMLVNLSEEGDEVEGSSVGGDVLDVSSLAGQQDVESIDSMNNIAQTIPKKPMSPSSTSTCHHEPADSTVDIERTFESDARVNELELLVAKLTSELEFERSQHAKTREALLGDLENSKKELQKVRNDLSNLKYQTAGSKNAYDRLLEECTRAKHDNEISQVAMRKMVKELSDLRSQRRLDENKARVDQDQADSREEDLLVAEMNETDKIIKEASRKIEELSEKSRKFESGIKLQVNEKISEVCTNLMKAVRNLIAQSRILQREIVSLESGGRVAANKEDFYKRNSAWTEGLISAANVVAMAARSLVDAADRSMSGGAKFTELAAAAHEVAAATTQLVVASRVKATRDSEKLKVLESAAKQVNQCTSNVVDTSRICAELIEQQEVDKIDIGSLSLHQTKKLEMETQVRLLELEDKLEKERVKLGLLRRQHYEQEDKQLTEAKTDVAPGHENPEEQ